MGAGTIGAGRSSVSPGAPGASEGIAPTLWGFCQSDDTGRVWVTAAQVPQAVADVGRIGKNSEMSPNQRDRDPRRENNNNIQQENVKNLLKRKWGGGRGGSKEEGEDNGGNTESKQVDLQPTCSSFQR